MGTEKARATAQGSHVLGSSKEKAYSAISLEAKTAADVFMAATLSGFVSATTTARTKNQGQIFLMVQDHLQIGPVPLLALTLQLDLQTPHLQQQQVTPPAQQVLQCAK